jgi:non-specific serine/threonine protein kinase
LPQLTRPDQTIWYRRLAVELDNCRAARAWSRAEPDSGTSELRLAGALARYWFTCGPGAEGREWLTQALARGPVTPTAARAQALTFSGQFECLHGDVQLGRRRVAEAVAVARVLDDGSLLSMTLRHLALYAGDRTTAPDLLEEAARVAQTACDARERALALGYLGAVYEQQENVARAEVLYTEALGCARRSGDATALADALDRLGTLAASRARYAEAAAMLREGLAHANAIGFGMYTSLAHRKLGQLALAQGDLAEARVHVRASLELARQLGRNALGLWPLQVAAILAGRLSRHERAVRLIAAATLWRAQHELRDDQTLWTRVLPEHDADVVLRLARSGLGDEAVALAWAEGGALTLNAALDEALADDNPDALINTTAGDGPPANPLPAAGRKPDELTTREREVAALIGRGCSNRQIAERLVITEGTAKIHVGRILAKLGFHSRAHLAAWAVQRGLIEPADVSR